MELNFNFELHDWMAFQKHHTLKSSQYKRSKLILTAAIPFIMIIFIVIYYLKDKTQVSSLIIYGIAGVIWLLIIPKWLERKTLKNAKKIIENGDNSGILGHHKLILTETGVLGTTNETKFEINWKGIKKLEESGEYYFLYNTSVSAIIIPKRKIEDKLKELDEILKNILK